MKAFTLKIDYVDYNTKTGKTKVLRKNIVNELWQLYEFQIMNIHKDFKPFNDHLKKWFIDEKVKPIIEEEENEEGNR